MSNIDINTKHNIIDHTELHLEGIYKISDVYLESCKYKQDRYVVFPMKAKIGEKLMFLYIKYNHSNHGSEGKIFYSHKIEKIQTLKNNKGSIQITTDDNQWVLNRVY